MSDLEQFLAACDVKLTDWQLRTLKFFMDPANEGKTLRWVHTRKGGGWMWVPKEPAS